MIGFVGAGNMARAIARGWGDPVLATDAGSGRAAALVAELGGEALKDNKELFGPRTRSCSRTAPTSSVRSLRAWTGPER